MTFRELLNVLDPTSCVDINPYNEHKYQFKWHTVKGWDEYPYFDNYEVVYVYIQDNDTLIVDLISTEDPLYNEGRDYVVEYVLKGGD